MRQSVDRQTFDEVMVPGSLPGAMIPVRGKGSRLWDQQGRDYIDLAGGSTATALGHCHPSLVDALCEQASTLWHLSRNWTHEPALRLAQQLCAASFADRVLFASSGADANEAALKLARNYALENYGAEKQQVIAFKGASHGQSLLTLSLGNHTQADVPSSTLDADIVHLPFNHIAELENTVSGRTCAVIIEPIQADGGVVPAHPEFLHRARELCDQSEALLIFDEVQTGIGRTGQLFAYMHSGVIPDILTCARALGGGFPIAAMLTHRHLANHFPHNGHQASGAGNPLACRVASRVLELISEPAVLQGVHERHQWLRHELEQINQQLALFQDIRGEGLLLGAVLSAPWKGRANELIQAAQMSGVLIQSAGPDVLRFTPALIIDEDDLALGIERLTLALQQRVRQDGG